VKICDLYQGCDMRLLVDGALVSMSIAYHDGLPRVAACGGNASSRKCN